MIQSAKKPIAILLVGTLVAISTFEANAVVARIAVGGTSAPSSPSVGAAVKGVPGSLGALNIISAPAMTLNLNGTLPAVSVSHVAAPKTLSAVVSHQVVAVVPTVAPSHRKALTTPKVDGSVLREKAAVKIGRIANGISREIKAAANLGRAGRGSAYGIGSKIEEVLTGRRGHRLSDLDAVNLIAEPETKRGVAFAEGWVEPSEAFEAAVSGAREAIFAPEFAFAEFDIASTDSGLRVSEGRFGFFGMKYEQWVRIKVTPSADGESLAVTRDQFNYEYSFNSGGVMMSEPIRGKVTLADAIRKVSAAMPSFVPKRVLYLKPSHILSGSEGMVYRMIDSEGTVVDADAITGVLDWSPALSEKPAVRHFVKGTVPAPTSKDNEVKLVERNLADAHWTGFIPQAIGSVLWASLLMLAAAGIGYAFSLSAAGAMLPVFAGAGFAALLTYVSGLESNYESSLRAIHPQRVSIGSMMMIGTILFGALSLTMGFLNVFPLAIGALGFAGVFGMMTAPPTLHSPASMYARAYEEAVRTAEKMGKSEENVYFGDSSAVMPVRDGNQWKFNFYLIDEPGQTKADSIFIELNNGIGVVSGQYETRVHVYKDVTLPADQPVTRFTPGRLERGVKVAPEAALDKARLEYPGLGASVSVSLQVQKEGEDGPRSLWYHFFDDYGSEAAVEARTGEVRILRKSERPTRQERKEQFQLIKKLRDLDSWLGENIPLYDTAKWIALLGIGFWLLDMAFHFSSFLPGVITIGALGVAGIFGGVKTLPDPGDLHERALEEAGEAGGKVTVEKTVDPYNQAAQRKESFARRFARAFDSIIRLGAALTPAAAAVYLGLTGVFAWPMAVGLSGLSALAVYALATILIETIESERAGFLTSVRRRWLRPAAIAGLMLLAGLGTWYLALPFLTN